MTAGHAILVVAAVSTGLFTGLLMTTLTFFQRTLKDLTVPEFALVMRRFLGVARTHPLNNGLVTASLLATIVALVFLRGSAGGPELVLVLASLLTFVAGSVLSVAVLRPVALQRLFGLEDRAAARGLAKSARSLLPPQRGPGPRPGSGLCSCSVSPSLA